MLRKGDEPVPGYRLEKFLGKGQFGEVWRTSAPGGTSAALKIIELGGKQGVKEFRAVQRVKEIRHTNLMPITALWVLDADGNVLGDKALAPYVPNVPGVGGTLMVSDSMVGARPEWLVVAMLLGEKSLHDRLNECLTAEQAGIPVNELLRYMEEAAKGIDYLNSQRHDLGNGSVAIQHCDIKPANIMLIGGAAVVCDFGLARALHDATVTATDMVGSPAYMAPECICRKPGHASDQYSLAVSYVELRTGRLPFKELSYVEVLDANRRATLDLSRLPPAEEQVIRRATSLDPSQRFDSAMRMVLALQDAVAASPRHWSPWDLLPWRRPRTQDDIGRQGRLVKEQANALVAQQEELSRQQEKLRYEHEALAASRARSGAAENDPPGAGERVQKQRVNLEEQQQLLSEREYALAAQREAIARLDEQLSKEREAVNVSRMRFELELNLKQGAANALLQHQRIELEEQQRLLMEREKANAAQREANERLEEELRNGRETLNQSRWRFEQKRSDQRAGAEQLRGHCGASEEPTQQAPLEPVLEARESDEPSGDVHDRSESDESRNASVLAGNSCSGKSVALEFTSGPLVGKIVEFKDYDRFLVGRRGHCHAQLDDPCVSRHQFLLEVNPPFVMLRDLGSLVGTYVNETRHGGRDASPPSRVGGAQKSPMVSVHDGDRISVGDIVMHVRVVDPSTCDRCGLPIPPNLPRIQVAELPERHCDGCRIEASKSNEPRNQLRSRFKGFDLEGELGTGPLGTVYKARRKNERDRVAVKVIQPKVPVDDRSRKWFQREIDRFRKLEHPNIVRLLEGGSLGREFHVAMEYCDAGNLKGLMERFGGKVPLEKLAPLMNQCLDGLQCLHSAKIVHGKIKPENILLTAAVDHWTLKVGDFGTAKNFELAGWSGFTLANEVDGTVAFIPREQITNYRSQEPVSDIWSTAATFYYALSGCSPLDVLDHRDPIEVLLQDDPVPIRERDPSVPVELASVLDRALAPEMSARYQSAAEFRSAIRQAVSASGQQET